MTLVPGGGISFSESGMAGLTVVLKVRSRRF